MRFKNRQEAGRLLGQALLNYKDKDAVVYGLLRGGVVTAAEIAKILNAPLDLILAHKIGHPYHAEYAIGAVSRMGMLWAIPESCKQSTNNGLNQKKTIK